MEDYVVSLWSNYFVMDKETKEELEKALADLEKKLPTDKATQKLIEELKKKLEE